MDFASTDDIRFEVLGAAGVITLTRPAALNALTHAMVKAISAALHEWAADPAVRVVAVKAEGRAFSAGGDLMAIYEGRADPQVGFFADEYRLNAEIARFPKPYVALVNGIVMGGGVGVAFHGSHRVLTENAVFAMPEVGIGFFPDVGASHLLSDLGNNFGLYLALTGARVKWGDALLSGLATHTVKAENLSPLLSELSEGVPVEDALRGVFAMARWESDQKTILSIDRWFSADSLDAVLAGLEKDAPDDPLAAGILSTIRQKAPTSLAVAFRSIGAGQTLSMDDCMRMEFRIVNRMLKNPDFYEGIRAAIVDKGSKPAWNPASLDAVRAADIDAFFADLPGGDLVL